MPFLILDFDKLTTGNCKPGNPVSVKSYIRWLRQEIELAETALRQWGPVPQTPAPQPAETRYMPVRTNQESAKLIDEFFAEEGHKKAWTSREVSKAVRVAYSRVCQYLRDDPRYVNVSTSRHVHKWKLKPSVAPKPPEPANAPA